MVIWKLNNGGKFMLCICVFTVVLYIWFRGSNLTNLLPVWAKQTLNFEQEVVGAKKPHILFIFADDYGYNDIGYHGSEIKTPHLDQLAKEGVRLENYYVQPICTPSRSQLMSGRYQTHTGLQHRHIAGNMPNALPRDSPTLPEKLREAGYSTHMIGKWHLGFYKKEFLPNNRGFDSFYGILAGQADHYNKTYCYDFCGYDFRDNNGPINPVPMEYSTHLYTRRVADLVHNYPSTKPMFLYLAFQAVHGPLEVPTQYSEPYSHLPDYNRTIYSGMVAAMDEAVGNITAALRAKGMWDDTILVFSTDNGGRVDLGGNNWPLRGWKSSLWEGGVRGVGFVNGKQLKNKGTISKELIHVSDWYPTLIGLAGGSLTGTKPLDGFDQWNTISNGASSPRDTLLHNIDPLSDPVGDKLEGSPFDNRYRAALRWKDWKIITGTPAYSGNGSWIPAPGSSFQSRPDIDAGNPKKNIWLFDIVKDPEERDDLHEKLPKITMLMLKKLQQANSTAVPCRYPPVDNRADPKLHGGYWGPWL
ncbi:arylsulfatase B-like isoform X1 [Pecten maximus]|uniref:arylsulfatase B-like isoform X1 n=1 Tax=Pecten maximus TaxID=6579 RepID=UPI0014585B15|nr:arylsulfatase B-like isoform X1 [Pecten maximus]